MEQVMSFKYLGVTITSSGDLEKEVKAQTLKASLIWIGLSAGYNMAKQVHVGR